MVENNSKATEFTALRAIFWPIHSYELKKFLPLGLMMFCALFCYVIVRDLKDAMIVKGISAESISYIKLGLVFPLSVLFVLLYMKMSNKLSRSNLFNCTVLPFLIFFSLFGFYLYPNRAALLPNPAEIETLLLNIPSPFFEFFIKIYSQWITVIFYAFAELWGSIIVSLLFWQFANSITRISEAKRYYVLLGLLGNLGIVFYGITLTQFIHPGDTFETSLKYITTALLIFGCLFIAFYHWTLKNTVHDSRLYDPITQGKQQAPLKLGFLESLKLILSSKYLWFMCLIVIAWGISMYLVEITWKKMIGIYFTNSNEYIAFMLKFAQYGGIASIAFIFLGQNIIRLLGWYKSALMTPIILLITGSIFYMCVINRSAIYEMTFLLSLFGNPAVLVIWTGQLQNFLSKTTKYSLFDPTKEMAYIPLEDELKVKGKAAVDIIGARFSKTGGPLIQIFLMTSLGISPMDPEGLLKIAPYLFVAFLAIVLGWIWLVHNLNSAFIKQTVSDEIKD